MHADPDAILALAALMRRRAEEIRHEALRLSRLLEATAWTGRAADAARLRSRRRLDDLHATAVLHERAAAALARHAAEVETRRSLLHRAVELVS